MSIRSIASETGKYVFPPSLCVGIDKATIADRAVFHQRKEVCIVFQAGCVMVTMMMAIAAFGSLGNSYNKVIPLAERARHFEAFKWTGSGAIAGAVYTASVLYALASLGRALEREAHFYSSIGYSLIELFSQESVSAHQFVLLTNDIENDPYRRREHKTPLQIIETTKALLVGRVKLIPRQELTRLKALAAAHGWHVS